MKGIVLRDDVFDLCMWQVACAGSDGLAGLSPDDTPFRNATQQLGLDLLADAEIQEGAMHHFLYTPLANTFTLGIYGMIPPTVAATEPIVSTDLIEAVEAPAEIIVEQNIAPIISVAKMNPTNLNKK